MGYLGSKMNPWRTKIRKNLVVKLKEWMSKLGKASLKPRQKLVMLKLYVLPRLSYIYPLTQDSYPMNVCKDLDSTLRASVRTWLKLPSSSPKAFFYESAGKGGLGLPMFELSVPAQSKSGECAQSMVQAVTLKNWQRKAN